MLSWPRARTETRSWHQTVRGGVREDRLLREVITTIPEFLGQRTLALPAELAARIDENTRTISALDASHGQTLAALGGLLLRTESVASSKIEQIVASMDDFARAMHGSKANSSAVAMVDATRATRELMDAVTTRGAIASSDLLRAHATLMSSDPAELPHAGHLRTMQNWVGGSDYSPREALLVPPPPELVPELMEDIVQFANRKDLPSLLQAAIAHAQFETVHPFTDGNGRIGRALVNAILRVRGTTSLIVVPLASALVAQRDAYFEALNSYRAGDVEPLLNDFVTASQIATEESAHTAARLALIPEQWRSELGPTRRDSAALRVLDLLLVNPVIAAVEIEANLSVSTSTVYASMERLQAAGIIRPLTNRTRNQIWGASALIDELDDLSRRIETRSAKAQL
ncbi:MAG TPA: fic protein [Actinobacteria bacterium]|nr:fic protein [Actinomycetota bacterium]